MSIDILFPQSKTIEIEGHSFAIREFKVAEFPMVLSLGARLTDMTAVSMALLIEDDAEKLFKLLSSVTGQPVEVIRNMRLEVMLHLVEQIMEANLDFFAQALPKAISRLAATMAGSRLSNS